MLKLFIHSCITAMPIPDIICSSPDGNIFDEYSQWLFRVLFELEKRVKLSAYPDQARLFGYLSERLINVYCIRHRLKIKYVPVIMPLEETFQNPSNLLYTLRQLKNDLIYKLTEL